jgi:hypothetical protein
MERGERREERGEDRIGRLALHFPSGLPSTLSSNL